MIDVRQLTYFVAVVEAKSLTAAAEVLSIAQPALSQHLRRLEDEFGQQLLTRHSRGVEPTSAGLRLVEHARAILTAMEAAKTDLKNFNAEPRSLVKVGMPRSICDALLVELMVGWTRAHPDIDLQVIEYPSRSLMEKVLSGRLDLAVTSFPSDDKALSVEPLLQEKMCAVMPGQNSASAFDAVRGADRGHHAPPFPQISFDVLAHEPLILYNQDNVSRQIIDSTAMYCSVKLHVAHEVDSAEVALRMVEENLGSTIQPYLAVRKYLGSIRATVREIVGPTITRRLHLIRSRYRPSSPHEDQVREALKGLLLSQVAHDNPMLQLVSANSE